MKYTLKNDDATIALGTLKEDWGEFEFTKERTFDDEETLMDYLYQNKLTPRELKCVYAICGRFVKDLLKRADDTRARRDEFATRANINIVCRSFYEHNHNLECYGSDFGNGFDISGDTKSNSYECRQFTAEHNYLMGIADGVWELGFTLVFNTDTGKHEVRGNRIEMLIAPSKYN